jgi:uncharacterized protein
MRRAVMWGCLLLWLCGVAAVSYAQQDSATCYVFEDGRFREVGERSPLECARAIGPNTTPDSAAFGAWGDYFLRAEFEGQLYAAQQRDIQSFDELDWELIGTWRLSFEEVMDLAARDINAFWESVFEQADQTYIAPNGPFAYNRRIRTGCGRAVLRNAFYCPVDHSMYYHDSFVEFFYDRIGDYAAVLILAHEWSHAIQAQIGVLGDDDLRSIQVELQADCFAGAYASYSVNSSTIVIVEEGDLEEAAQALFNFGDPEDTPWFSANAHGTGEQRVAAFELGYEEGLSRCLEITEG